MFNISSIQKKQQFNDYVYRGACILSDKHITKMDGYYNDSRMIQSLKSVTTCRLQNRQDNVENIVLEPNVNNSRSVTCLRLQILGGLKPLNILIGQPTTHDIEVTERAKQGCNFKGNEKPPKLFNLNHRLRSNKSPLLLLYKVC